MLGDVATVTGVLALGSEHTTKESQRIRIWDTKPDGGDRALDWLHVYVFTGRTPDELDALVIVASVNADPGKARGIDAAVRALGSGRFGSVLLMLAAVGFAAYGLYCFALTRYARM